MNDSLKTITPNDLLPMDATAVKLLAAIGSYKKRDVTAALRYGDQRLDGVSIGLGARVQSLTGESVFNRCALLEGRVLERFNAGDRRSVAGVGLATGIGQAGGGIGGDRCLRH